MSETLVPVQNPPNLSSEIRNIHSSLVAAKVGWSFRKLKMDYPPNEWVIFQAADFDTMEPRNPGDWGMEVLAQIRSNGRISDHWRIALGGTKVVEASFQLSELLPAASQLPDWTVNYQMFPRDITI